MQRKYGWHESKRQESDLKYSAGIHFKREELPVRVDLRPFCSDVEDQGQLGSCVANASTSAFEFLEVKHKKRFIDFSRLFVYYNTREMENSVDEDAGCMIRDAVKSLAKQGVCPELTWPYLEQHVFDRPPEDAYREALAYQALGYYAVDDLYEVKHAISHGLPVIFGFEVPESFEGDEIAKTGLMKMPEPGERTVGGHAVLAVGYDSSEQKLIVRNSWSKFWGMSGYFKMPEEIITMERARDFWVIERVEQICAERRKI